jgi:tetratricopeptide (TPR) repeat protein
LLPTEDFSVRLGLATAYARLGRSSEARALFDRLLRDDNSAEVQLALGQAYLAMNEFEDAEKAFRRAAQQRPSMPGLHFFLGAARWKRQDADGAIEEWRAELALDPRSFEALFALGAVLADSGDPDEARALLVEAQRRKPNHAQTLYYLGKLAWKQKRIEALDLLGRSVQIESGSRPAHYLLSRIYTALGRKAEASRELEIVRRLAASAVQEEADIVASAR